MSEKEQIRARFREAVFARAGRRCQGPGCTSASNVKLDAHHITNRKLLPAGGYVAENGIALCDLPGGCHERAEAVDRGALVDPRFTAEVLYRIIGSSAVDAMAASERLAAGTYEPPRGMSSGASGRPRRQR
jgi:hypothetical protein